MALISLSGGRAHTLVDDEDEAWLNEFSWSEANGYALTVVDGCTYYLHRLLFDAPPNMRVIRLNGVGLDNRRANLRLVTPSAALKNRKRGPRGVSLRGGARSKPWRAVYLGRHLGYFASKEQAEEAWLREAALDKDRFIYERY